MFFWISLNISPRIEIVLLGSGKGLDVMRRNQHRRMQKRLAELSPPLGSASGFHRHDDTGKLRAGQPVPEAFSIEFPTQDLLPFGIETHHMERVFGQIDANGDKGRFRSDFRLLWGLDFHAFSSHNGKGYFAFGGEAFLAPLPIFVRERIPDREPASHPRLHGPFHYARANVQSMGKNIWIEEYPCKVFGVALGRRMTVIRLKDGRLLLHSPGEMTDDRKRCLESLGRVSYIVAPARFHDLFLDQAVRAFPLAELHAIRPIFSRFSSRSKTFLLSGQPVFSWGTGIEPLDFRAGPFHTETVFFHRESRSLLLADLCFCLSDQALVTQLVGRGLGITNRFAPTRDIRLWTLGSRQELRDSIEKILKWPFEKIIPAHGEIVPEKGREAFQEAFLWA